jgi:hypothetical protein
VEQKKINVKEPRNPNQGKPNQRKPKPNKAAPPGNPNFLSSSPFLESKKQIKY